MATIFDILMRLDTSGFSRGARNAQKSADDFKDSLKQLGGYLAGIGLLELGRQALVVSTDFDDALTQINTLVGESREQIAEWRGELLKMGPELGKGPVELAKALYSITGAGARGAEALEIMRQAALASSLGMGDTQTVAKAVVATLEAYGRGNITAAAATETLRNAVREGNLEASELAPALGKVTGLAASMGVEFAELTGFIAKFTKSGGNASEGVTGLRAILNTFLDATPETEKALKGLGTSLDAVRESIREKGLAATLVDLFERIGDNKDALAKLFPSVEALSAALNVVASDGGKDYLEVIGRVATLNNDLASTFDMVRKANPGQALRDLAAMGQSLQISLGDGLARSLMQAVAGLGDMEQQTLAAERIGEQLGKVLGMLVKALDLVADHAYLVEAAFKAWMALKVIAWVNGGVAALKEMAAASGGAAAGMGMLTIGLGAVLVAVLAINEVIVNWSRTMQAEIDTMVEQAARFAKALGDTKKSVALAIASNNSKTISDELKVQLASYNSLVERAKRAKDELNAISEERAKREEELVARGIRPWEGAFRSLAEEFRDRTKNAERALNELNAQTNVTSEGVGELFTALQTAGTGAEDTGKKVAKLSEEIQKFFEESVQELREHRALMAAMGGSGDQAAERLAKIRTAIEAGLDPIGDMTDAWRANLEELALVQAAIEAGLNPMTDMSAAVVAQLKLVIQSRVEWVLWAKKVADVRGETLDLLQQIQGLGVSRKVILGLAAAQREFEKATILAKIAELALSESFHETLAKAGVTLEELFEMINVGFARITGAPDAFTTELFELTYEAERYLAAVEKGPAAVAAFTAQQDRAAERTRLLGMIIGEVTDAQRLAIEAWLDLREAAKMAPVLQETKAEFELMQKLLAVDPHAFNSLREYREELERVRQAAEEEKKVNQAIERGAKPEEIQSIRDYYAAIKQGQQILEQRNVETVWQAGVKGMSDALQSGLSKAGTDAIAEWVEIGDSFVENLLESLIEAFASAALQAAISAAFSGNSGGIWGGLVNAFTGGGGGFGGGGGAGGGGGTGWISTLAGAYQMWRNGSGLWNSVSSLWGGAAGTAGLMPAGTGVMAATPAAPYYVAAQGGAYSVPAAGAGPITASTGSGAGAAGGLSAGMTAAAVAGVAAAIIVAFNLWNKHRKGKQYESTGETFSLGYGTDPNAPPAGTYSSAPMAAVGNGNGIQFGTGSSDEGAFTSYGPGGPGNTSGGGYRDGTYYPTDSTAQPFGNQTIPEIQAAGSLAQKLGAEQVEQIRRLIEDSTVGLVESLGGVVKGIDSFTLNVTNNGKKWMVTMADGFKEEFDSAEEALKVGIARMLDSGKFEGLTANISAVLSRANEIGLDGLDAALAMAQAADQALAKETGEATKSIGLFEQQNKALQASLAEMTAEAQRYGLSAESIAALTEERRKQLEMEQQLVGGQALTSLLNNLFDASAAAAGDAELAAMYTYELGAIRIAQLQMEAAEFFKLGYISAEVFARIQGYILALDPNTVSQRISSGGWGGGRPSGGDSGASQREQEAERRAARKAEIEQQIADMASGLTGLSEAARQKGRDLREAIEEMNELGIDPKLIDQFWELSKGEAIKQLLEQANQVIANAGRSDFATRRAEMDAFWDEQIQGAFALGAELGVNGWKLVEPILEAQRIQRQQLAESAIDSLGLPLENTRKQAKALTDALDYLAIAQADGSISAERYAEIIAQSQTMAMTTLYGMAASLLEQTGGLEMAAEMRAKIAEMQFDMEVAQLELLYKTVLAAGLLSDEAKANMEAALAFIKDPANRPDFTQIGNAGGPGPADNDNEQEQQAEDLARLRQSVLDQIQAWRDLAIDPVTKQARELTKQLAELRANAIKAGVSMADVNAAWAIARADFIRQQLAPYEGLADPLGNELKAINQHFFDLANAFREIGASAEEMARLETARQDAITAFYERVDQQAQTLLDRLMGGDLATGTRRQQFESAQAEFQALAARLAANPQDLEARAGIAAAGERLLQAAQAYNSGALYGDMAALVQRVLMGLLGGGNVVPFPIPPQAPGPGSPTDRTTRGGMQSPAFPNPPAGGAADVRNQPISPGEGRVISILGEIRDALRGVTGAVETGNRQRLTLGDTAMAAAERQRRTVDEKLGSLPNDLARAIGGRR